MSDFSSVYYSILSKMVCSCFVKISCQIIFVNKHWPSREKVPLIETIPVPKLFSTEYSMNHI